MAKKKTQITSNPTGEKQLLSDALVKAQMALVKDGGALRATADVTEFNKKLIYTGLIELDQICRPGFQSRIQLLGDPSAGKTLLCYIFERAAQRTCRLCYTPILDFVNDKTGEIARTCKCGKNEGMVVVHFDFAQEFDAHWAHAWGVQLGDTDISKYTEIIPGVKMAPNAKFVVVRMENIDQASVAATHLLSDGAVDLVVIDDLASLASKEMMDGKRQPGTKARAVSNLVTAINSSAAACWVKHRTSPTIIFPNQYRTKIGGNVMADPREASGGLAARYHTFQTWNLRTAYQDQSGGFTGEHTYGDVTVKPKKDKFSGSTGSEAKYRVYLKPMSVSRVQYDTGDTDEGSKLWGIVNELGEGGLGDKRWSYKDNKGYHVLGRTFASAMEIKAFLSRPDIGYMLRLPIFALRLPSQMRKHLNVDTYSYTPWKDDPILELINEATKLIGTNVVSARDDAGSHGTDEPVGGSDGAEEALTDFGIDFEEPVEPNAE